MPTDKKKLKKKHNDDTTYNTTCGDNDGYENLEFTKSKSGEDDGKSIIKSILPKKPMRSTEKASKQRGRGNVRARGDIFEAPPSSSAAPELEGNSEYNTIDYKPPVEPKRESASGDKNKKVVTPQRQIASGPTGKDKKKKIGCCTLL